MQRQAFGVPRRHRSSLKGWAIAVAVVAIAGALTWFRFPASSSPGKALNDTRPVTNGPVPSSAPTRPAGPPADPFAGSPAEGYADGQAGIVVPAAHAVGSYSAAEVKAAFTKVRELLIAANLNPHTLAGGSPDAFARLLTARQRADFIAGLDKTGVTARGYARSTRGWVTSFAPGTTKIIAPVRVHGTMSAAATKVDGRQVLRVHADYLFVYAVEPPGMPADWMRIVDRNYANVDFATWDDPGGALEPWLYLWNAGGTAGGRCDVNDGFVHPGYPSGPPDKVRPSGAPINPYDQATAPDRRACGATTGT